VIALIPTGGGKSLTFQLSAMTENGISLVIMPLLSLIEDQMNQMKEIGVPCIFAQKPAQIKSVFKEMKTGKLTTKLLFITPEKICQSQEATDLLRNLYNQKLLKRFVIDEVH
jgi:superfamily II DNA helicase RecQ